MNNIPEFAAFTKPGEKARTLRESVNGQLKFSRIPIRRRQLRYEVENFTNWIARLIQSELEMCKEDPTYPRFFSGGNTSLLIIAEDRGGNRTSRDRHGRSDKSAKRNSLSRHRRV